MGLSPILGVNRQFLQRLTGLMYDPQLLDFTQDLDQRQGPDDVLRGRPPAPSADHERFVLFQAVEILGDASRVAAGDDAAAGVGADGREGLVEHVFDVVLVGGIEVVGGVGVAFGVADQHD